MSDGALRHSSDSSSTMRKETATWVRWTEDGRLQQRWWIEEETSSSRRGYEEWRDVPVLQSSTS
jgi:hypothetical protein